MAGGTETDLTLGKRRALLMCVAIALGVIAEAWTFLPPVSMLGWWTWLFIGGRFESWWYALPDERRSQLLYDLGTGAADGVLPLVVFLLFIAWTRPLWRADAHIGARALVPVGFVAIASLLHVVIAWPYALKYQGLRFMATYVVVSVAWLSGLWYAYRSIRSEPTWHRTLLWHSVAGAWVITMAFPWLGEYI